MQLPSDPIPASPAAQNENSPANPPGNVETRSNRPPTASAGSNIPSVAPGATVNIQGIGTDPDGGQLSYMWVQTMGPTVQVFNNTSEKLVFDAPVVDIRTRVQFRLTVTDDQGAMASDTVSIFVDPPPAPANPSPNPPTPPPPPKIYPVVDAGLDISVDSGKDVTLHATATDADGVVVTFQWQQIGGAPVTLQGATSADILFNAPSVTTPMTLTFRITVTDDSGLSAMDVVKVGVSPFISCATSCSTGNPVILYTDLVAGPTSGGENNNGAYLNIFGINFGSSSGLGSDTKVYINGSEVADYKLLGNAKSQPFKSVGVVLQHLAVQVGALGGLSPGASGEIKVVVKGVASNTNLAFMNQPGQMIYVALNGDDVAGDGSFSKPYRYVQNARRTNPAWAKLRPGDTIVMREGTWADAGWDNRFVRIHQDLNPTEPNGVPGNGYLAFQAYPGENVLIELSVAAGNHKGGFSGPPSDHHANSHYVVFSGFTIQDDDATKPSNIGAGGPFNSQTSGDHWRIVNNEMTVRIGEVSQKAAGISGGFRFASMFGNYIHDVQGITTATATISEILINHGMYFDNYTNDLEIAYNYIEKVSGGSGLQFYGNLGSSCGYPACLLERLNIHHNVIDTVSGKFGLNLSIVTASGVVYNNVVMHTKLAGLRLGSNEMSNMDIVYNSFFDVAYGQERGAVFLDGSVVPPDNVNIENNIFYLSTSSPSKSYYTFYNGAGSDSALKMKKNVWFGGAAAPPAKDDGGIYGNPGYRSIVTGAEDLRIDSTSAAYGTGGIGSFVPVNDMLMKPRTGALDAGAFQVAR